MIELHCRHFDKSGSPIIPDATIQDYAEKQLADYKPGLLKEPSRIDALRFLEVYLGVNIDFQDIYYPEGTNSIAGATVFNREKVRVFDREQKCTRVIDVPANTVLIDNKTMEPGKDAFARFTQLHEGGHSCIHPIVFRRDPNQISLFDTDELGPSSIVCCRKNVLDFTAPKKSTRDFTAHDWREHQANTYAAAIAMPRPTFVPMAEKLIKDCGFWKGVFIEPNMYDPRYERALNLIVLKLAVAFGTSKSAVKVHMKKLGLLVSEHELRVRQAKLVVDL